MEEELSSTTKKLSKAEKTLKQVQLREQQKDSTLLEKQLSLKSEETEVFQKQLQVQKQENQKLREKVKELLTKQGNSGGEAPKQELEFQKSKAQRLEIENKEASRRHEEQIAKLQEEKMSIPSSNKNEADEAMQMMKT